MYTNRTKLLYSYSKLTRSKLCSALSCCSFISTSPALDPYAIVAPQFPGYMFYSGCLKSTQEHAFVFSPCSTITNNLIRVVTSCRYLHDIYLLQSVLKSFRKSRKGELLNKKKVSQASSVLGNYQIF